MNSSNPAHADSAENREL